MRAACPALISLSLLAALAVLIGVRPDKAARAGGRGTPTDPQRPACRREG